MTEEKTLWEGTSSHLKDLGFHLLCWLVVLGIPFSLWRMLVTRCHRYTVTTERLQVTEGVLSRRLNELELYRVKDTGLEQPLVLRLFGLGNVIVRTSDPSSPVLVIQAIPNARDLREQLRGAVEKLRESKGVREIDVGA